MSTSTQLLATSGTRTAYALACALFALTACETKTETVTVVDTVIVEAPRYTELPEGAGGFVGYRSTESAPANTCGECHAGTQADWVSTGHADAWAGLENSGHSQTFCEGCHTVGALGNTSTADAGWTATGDDRYHDVGCESCHGPGQNHIDVPDVSAGPLAQVAVSVDPLVGCGQCHNGSHHGFVDEWAESPHSDIVGFAAGRDGCKSCHSGQGTLAAWGENANYLEKNDDPLATTCAVCHDPHGSDNDANTRFSARENSIDGNLCAKCHNRRTSPDAESSHGLAPHAPQAAVLLGLAGWFPPDVGFTPGQLVGTHGSTDNEEWCATCHVSAYTVTDEEGGFVQNVTGHLFISIPCTDEAGLPTNEDCGYTTADRTYEACTGCHAVDVAQSLLFVATSRIADRAGEVLDLLWMVDPNLDGPGGEIDPGNPLFTTAEGAFYNVNLAQFPEEGSEEPGDNPLAAEVTGATTHNPFLIEALLLSSKAAIEKEYGVGAAGRVDYQPEIDELLRKGNKHGNTTSIAQQ